MSNNTQNRPVKEFKSGNIKVALWEKQTEKGTFYITTIEKSYKDDSGEWKKSDSYTQSELLKIGRLTTRAYDWIDDNK